MRHTRIMTWVGAVALLGALAPGVAAQPGKGPLRKAAPAEIEGATRLVTIKSNDGFVDDPFVFDGAGGRLVWVRTDGAAEAEAKIVDLGQGGILLTTVRLSEFTAAPIEIAPVLGGDSLFVVAHPAEGDPREVAALIDGTGAVVRRFGPADDVALTERAGAPVVATYSRERKPGKKGDRVVHTVALAALATGKPVGKKQVFDADETGYVAKLDMRILYFLDGYTRLVTIKGGTWNKKEDQRSPDREAWFDVPAGTVSKQLAITDVLGHTRRTRLRADHWNQGRFVMVAPDLSALHLVADGEPVAVELAQPFHHYDPKSLAQQGAADGALYFSLAIDPVNADAVARKKADVQWLDLYRLEPAGAVARRLARLRLDKREVSWRAAAGYWAVLTRHVGFDRGGKVLDVFKLAAR